MKIAVCTFSGTGNTFLTASGITTSIESRGITIRNVNIEKSGCESDLSDYDHILIGYPIHAFNAPKNVVDFVKNLPESNGKHFSIFKVSGEPFSINNGSSDLILKIMKSKGYIYMVEMHFLMPYNIMFRYPEAVAKQMYLYMMKKADFFVENIICGRQIHIQYTAINQFISFLFRIQWGGARINGRLYTCNMKKCTKCLLCINNCPANNIRFFNDRIRFDGKCLMCMRCVQVCRFSAINIGLLRYWVVRQPYDYSRLSEDNSIPSDYITNEAKGYFRLFKSYFER